MSKEEVKKAGGTGEKLAPRLLEDYRNRIRPELKAKFGIKNDLSAPRLEKIVVNMGVGKAVQDAKILDEVLGYLARVTGQKPFVTRAKKAVAGFKLRQGQKIGAKVTLRGARMYEFFDRLVSVVIPRIRDFRGCKATSFDASGNYSLGLADQIIFPEIDIDDVTTMQGMVVNFIVKDGSPEKSFALLQMFGFPFKRTEEIG